jgi:hypothetical protein
MPNNFPEVWLKRVVRNMEQANKAPWLDGIPELPGNVIEVGAGTETEQNIMHIPLSTFEPNVLINNSTYPLNAVEYSDSNATLTLDKYQTEVTTLGDDQVMGASYDKIDEATYKHVLAITKKKYAKAIHAQGPASNTAATPVLKTTGAASGGRKILTYDDLIALKAAKDAAGEDAEGRRLVLCTDHWNDLLTDRDRFGNLLFNYVAGTPAPVIAGFKIFQYIANPYYTVSTLAKKAFGAAPAGGDYQASICFNEANVGKKTGNTKQYYLPSQMNPRNQSNELNYRHYFVALPFVQKYIGAIVSDVAS